MLLMLIVLQLHMCTGCTSGCQDRQDCHDQKHEEDGGPAQVCTVPWHTCKGHRCMHVFMHTKSLPLDTRVHACACNIRSYLGYNSYSPALGAKFNICRPSITSSSCKAPAPIQLHSFMHMHAMQGHGHDHAALRPHANPTNQS